MRLWERENARNEANEALFRAMLLMAYPDTELVVAGHHIFHKRPGSAAEEIPSADALIFDHVIAKAVWGDDWLLMMSDLAILPVPLRDDELRKRYNARWGTSY